MLAKKIAFFCLFFLFAISVSSVASVPSPQEILGFKVGEDFKLANWSQILTYFEKLASSSEKIKIIDLGQSTLGRRFIMAVISSPENMTRLEEIRNIQKKLHDPRTIQPGEKENLVKEGKAIVLISCSIHSTEIAASQMSLELAYKLVSEVTPEIQKILEEAVLLLLPSTNPDGIDLVCDWYSKQLGTPYEASSMPWLYHYYAGHDNNRDWFMLTQKETQLVTRVLYHEWFPLLVYDVHQMGSRGIRLFIPPYDDPVNPNIDPLLLRELHILMGKAAVDLTKQGKTGVATNVIYDTWYNSANRAAPLRHNMFGILSEAASANLASPIFIRKNEIQLREEGFETSDIQSSYLEPWPGGWWRIRDIIDYEEITAFSLLKTISQNKEKYLSDFSLFAERQIEKGKLEPPFAYLIPLDQKDLPTAYKLLQVLQGGGAEIYEAQNSFMADEVIYPSKTFIIPLTQPYRAFIKDLMERKAYPLLMTREGAPDLPYDEASWTLPLQMGVKAIQVTNSFKAEMKLLAKIEMPQTKFYGKGSSYFLLPNQANNESILLNRLHKKGIKIHFSEKPFNDNGQSFPAGTIVLDAKDVGLSALSSLSKDLGINIFTSDREPKTKLLPLSKPKLGIYQSWVANTDEGWIRWTLEQFEFPFKLIHNEEMKAGNLNGSYTHIILPGMSSSTLIEGRKEGDTPPQYAGGIGKEGISSLESFVQNGGKLIAIGNSSDFAIQYFGLPLKNLVTYPSPRERTSEPSSEKERKERIYCPGSLLEVQINDSHPVGFGMGKEGAIFSYFSPVFAVEKGEVIASYPLYNPLLSGIIINEDKILGKAAAAECSFGRGKVLLLGFNVIHRAQAQGSFKFLFNSLLY